MYVDLINNGQRPKEEPEAETYIKLPTKKTSLKSLNRFFSFEVSCFNCLDFAIQRISSRIIIANI